MVKQVAGKLSPSDLDQKFIFTPVTAFIVCLQHALVYLPVTDQAPGEIRRESGCSVDGGLVSSGGIGVSYLINSSL